MEEEKITVSVVVPVYQTPLELLRRCLDSLEAQTLEGVEVLLAFDEPADGYRDTVAPYAQRMALRVLELPHGGVSAARNAGIRHAQGEWISFVDADDWIDPEMLARQVQEGESRGADIIMTEHVMEYGASSQPRGYQSQAMLFAGEDKRRFECDVLKPQTGAGFVTAKLLRRALLMEREIFFREELSAAEDAEFDGTCVRCGGETVSLRDVANRSLAAGAQELFASASHGSPVSPPPFMAGAAEVDIDPETGEVRVVDYCAVVDCGTVVNPNLARVQTEGGIAQGIGMALYEDVRMTDRGRMMSNSFMQYKIPTRLDVPSIRVEFEQSYEPTGPFGAKSIGEIVINTPAPAIADAVYNAVGVRVTDLPITPEKVLRGMGRL